MDKMSLWEALIKISDYIEPQLGATGDWSLYTEEEADEAIKVIEEEMPELMPKIKEGLEEAANRCFETANVFNKFLHRKDAE